MAEVKRLLVLLVLAITTQKRTKVGNDKNVFIGKS